MGDREREVEEEGGRLQTRTMYSPLGAVVRGDLLTLPMDAPIRAALEALGRARGGCVVVVADPRRQVPVGVFTERDAIRRVALAGADLDAPVAEVMTSGLVTLGLRATAHQAVLAMARHGVRRVVVVDDAGGLAGVVSREELFALQRTGVDDIGAEIQAARDVAGLRGAAAGVRRLARGLLARGAGAETIAQSISTLHDLLTVRVVDLAAERFDLPPVPICWIALGSEGRLEQTFVTDQDNGLVFDPAGRDPDAVRAALLPFARAVNDDLDAIGFPRCEGEIMAGNPRWCLSVDEWRLAFSAWIDGADPEALLHATIFFDLRAVHGAERLVGQLRDWLLAAVMDRPAFLQAMARNALRHEPPLGTFRDFAVERSGEHAGTVDLKKQGSVLFVDAARVLALALGVPHTSTAERLRAVAEAARMAPADVASLVDGFHFVHLLRLRWQAERAQATNRVNPAELGELDRAVLKESFRQAKRLQARLAARFRVE